MKCLDLFAGGCNGFGLAAKWMGWQTVACVEIDPFCQKLLKQNFPEAEIYGDIREFNRIEAAKYRGSIDIITGGFPCQPFSHAGKREGTEDDRYLWPQMLETIRIIQPAFVIGENVAGLTSMDDGRTFDNILASLEDEGYTVESFVVPACGVGGWHKRDRVWIVAYSIKSGLQKTVKRHGTELGVFTESSNNFSRLDAKQWTLTPRNRGDLRAGNGIPNWMDRIASLGNAVVPQVVYEIYKAIKETFLT